MKRILLIIACLLPLDSLAEEQDPIYHNFYCDTICIQTQALNENIISNKTLGGFPLFDKNNVIEINGGLYDDIVRVVQLYLNVDKRVEVSIHSDNIIELQGINKRRKDRDSFFVFHISKEGYIIKQ